jgi:hypothetical protein
VTIIQEAHEDGVRRGRADVGRWLRARAEALDNAALKELADLIEEKDRLTEDGVG